MGLFQREGFSKPCSEFLPLGKPRSLYLHTPHLLDMLDRNLSQLHTLVSLMISAGLAGEVENRERTISMLYLQMRKSRLREVKGVAQGHTVRKQLSQDWLQGLSGEKQHFVQDIPLPVTFFLIQGKLGIPPFSPLLPASPAQFLGTVKTYTGRPLQEGLAFLSLRSLEVLTWNSEAYGHCLWGTRPSEFGSFLSKQVLSFV